MKNLSRRTVLRGLGVSLALPVLEAMLPSRLSAAAASSAAPRRLVAINMPLGFLSENFFPKATGRDYELSPYLKIAEALRNDFTVFSGTSHPDVDGGHSAELAFLTAAPRPGARTFKNTISLDQYAAQKIGDQTRFASLTVGNHSLSWSANGVPVPVEEAPSKVFARLFLQGSKEEIAAQERDLNDGRSIMDAVLEDAKSMERKVSSADRDKLGQFFTAVRETEQRLAKAGVWSRTPKPQVAEKSPGSVDFADVGGTLRAHFEVIRLALQTDSTRIVALGGSAGGLVPPLPGVSMGYHGLSHHGKNPEMMKQLEIVDRSILKAWVDFLVSLKESKEGGGSLLDNTQVLLGSNLGNASGHLTTNLPVVLAGGGYRHGQHLAFDAANNFPLPNLFVSMLQRLGIETDRFASSTGTMRGLEAA